jgi:hypothetical protein
LNRRIAYVIMMDKKGKEKKKKEKKEKGKEESERGGVI